MIDQRPAAPLTPAQVRRRVDPAALPFETTASVPPLASTIGQPRAFDAIAFGLENPVRGFNLYVAGVPGSGRESTIREYVNRFAADRPAPPDWLYLHNFDQPDQPIAISVPPGVGRAYATDLGALISDLRRDLPGAFESEEVQRRRDTLIGNANERKSAMLATLQEFATKHGFQIEMTPTGIVSYAMIDGKQIEKEAFELLTDEQKHGIEINGARVQERIAAALRQFRQLDVDLGAAMKQLETEVVNFATAHRFDELRTTFAKHPRLVTHLERIEADVPEHMRDFLPSTQVVAAGATDAESMQRNERLGRYAVNVFVDNADAAGAPVVIERNPTFANLFGRVDYRAVFGAMVTDFRQIRSGSLHRANGGYLILQVLDVLRSPFAWETLKRSLECSEIEVVNVAEQLAPIPTAKLRPGPIPLDVKVILIGPHALYPRLYHEDEDFPGLFPVKADFSPDMEWSKKHELDYAGFISRHVVDNGLRHFDRSAVGRVIEEGARMREHQGKLSTQFREIGNLVVEASHWAVVAGREIVTADDVDRAVSQRIYRASSVEERMRELIIDGTVQIATEGTRLGQVNGLAIFNSGDYAFGRPSRVSARVSAGKGSILSIEREIEMSGPIHSKGFLILSGFLRGQYGRERPLAFGATITFEQSYEGIDGDSASSAELYALLSAIAGVPLKQSIAVTGSVNQMGEVQAVGGVTRKIEGFFDVCNARGLTGEQGVLAPASNVKNLMLRNDVVAAVAAGQFNIWPIRTIDEGIELLTGVPAGERADDGTFPAGSIHRMVDDRIAWFTERAKEFESTSAGENDKPTSS